MPNLCGICDTSIETTIVTESSDCNCGTGNDGWASGFRGYYNRCNCKTSYNDVTYNKCITCKAGVIRCNLCSKYYPRVNYHINSCKKCYKSINPTTDELIYIFDTNLFEWRLKYKQCYICKSMIYVYNITNVHKFITCCKDVTRKSFPINRINYDIEITCKSCNKEYTKDKFIYSSLNINNISKDVCNTCYVSKLIRIIHIEFILENIY